jgi:hypothetical protein
MTANANVPTPSEPTEVEPASTPNGRCITNSEQTFQRVQESILGLWEVVNTLASIRPPKRERYRVTIFGSAQMQPDSPLYQDVRWLASELTVMGCDIITGGGPGLMQAANEGSVKADPLNLTESVGIRVDLGFEQETNPFVEHLYQHRTFFSRLHHFVLLSDAFVVVPGGIGTTLEALMIWQVLQAQQLHTVPLIMIGDMWADLVSWAQQHMVDTDPPLATTKDIQLPHCVNRFADAIALLRQSQAVWKRQCLDVNSLAHPRSDCNQGGNVPMTNTPQSIGTNADWFSQGKSDAWAGRPKDPPEHDPQAASLYDLGYDEGTIQRSPV